MKEDPFDDIRERLSDFEMEEPAHLWEQIEARLLQEEADKKRRPILLWHLPSSRRKMVGVAVVLLLMVVSVGLTLFLPTVPIMLPEIAKTAIADTVSRAVAPIAPTVSVSLTQERTSMTFPAKDQGEEMEKKQESIEHVVISRDEERERVEYRGDTSEEKMKREETLDRLPSWEEDEASSMEQTDKKSVWSVSAFASCGVMASSRQTFAAQGDGSGLQVEPTNWRDKPLLGILTLNKGRETTRLLRHALPIRAGLNVGYRFHERLSIETGISYACLLSNGEEGSSDHYVLTEQTLHYVGIPLTLRCTIYAWRGLEIYGAVGGMVEKCVTGSIRSEYVLNKETLGNDIQYVTEKPYQFSAHLILGLQYNFVPWAGVYLEPGGAYYFDDRSTLQTIYKQRPFNFNFNMGIRFTIGKN